MAKFVWSVTNNTATAEWYNACQEALNNKGTLFHFMLLKTFHLTIHGNSELHIATSGQMLKSFWNASTITDYILEIEFFWEKDIKVVLWVGNATLIFSALESWLVVEHNKRGFAQQWLSLTFSWATSEAVMTKAWSWWYFPYQKTQVPILKAQVKSSSVFPSYMAYQPDINKKMRAILIDWLIKVHYKFQLTDETQFIAVNDINMFLERRMVIRKKLQLVGVTAMLLARKYEELPVPIVKDYVMKEFDSIFELLKNCMVNLCSHLPTSYNSRKEVKDMVETLGLLNSFKSLRWMRQLQTTEFKLIDQESETHNRPPSSVNLFVGGWGEVDCIEVCDIRKWPPTSPLDHKSWRVVPLLEESYLALGQAYKEDGQFHQALQVVEFACSVYGSMSQHLEDTKFISSMSSCFSSPTKFSCTIKKTTSSNSNFSLETIAVCTLTKLVLNLEEIQPSKVVANKATTHASLIMVSMLQLSQSLVLPHLIDNDSQDRNVLCIQLLCHKGEVRKILLESFRQSIVKMLAYEQLWETKESKAKAHILIAPPHDLIDFYHLKGRKGMSQFELEDEVQDDLKRATREFTKVNNTQHKLSRILQLTGFSDMLNILELTVGTIRTVAPISKQLRSTTSSSI
ncbi:hypothetical protein EV2_044102 [Malus domestica]